MIVARGLGRSAYLGAIVAVGLCIAAPAQVEAAEPYVAHPTIIFQPFRPTYALLRSDSTAVTTGTPDVFLLDASPTRYVLTASDLAAVCEQEAGAQAYDEVPPVFVLTTREITSILQLAKHTTLLHVNKSYTICQTTARYTWLLSKNT